MLSIFFFHLDNGKGIVVQPGYRVVKDFQVFGRSSWGELFREQLVNLCAQFIR